MTFNTSLHYDVTVGWIKTPNTVLDFQVHLGHLPSDSKVRDYISHNSGLVYNIAGYYINSINKEKEDELL